MPQSEQQPSFGELLASTERTAVHLELRDVYGDNPRFAAWRDGHRTDWDDRASWWHSFHEQIAQAVRRGVAIRRARVVSEPVSEYIRWEHYATRSNVEAGEAVRWLPRRRASDLLLPPNDYWVFDDRLVRVHHFAGDGSHVVDELSSDPELAKQFSSAFESVWERGTPHDEYAV
ncbi:hypothetical protein EKH77_12345 [Streptomyces luteoverticillatus]|uniref:DUF6879 domain-containing protein n=1 Tax=Streptomyces luteoverticillatus TaxID=66425 RepID=A0A3Q9FYD3_STRLT|nr:DUF6879 family protein [Streptomyces luteoverticillatus]AZQ71893.1 hypothetical protein EKH77_12345 [Streptomyces luteoverticillatus]